MKLIDLFNKCFRPKHTRHQAAEAQRIADEESEAQRAIIEMEKAIEEAKARRIEADRLAAETERIEAERLAAEEAEAALIPRSNKETTLIIFDWDDTLFPTSEFGSEEREYWAQASEETRSQTFGPVMEACLKILTEASELGVVKIVSQASGYWVSQSCRLFMAELVPHLTNLGIEVISARDEYAEDPSVQKEDYKALVFRNLVDSMIASAGVDTSTNLQLPVTVLSIGNGDNGIRAANSLDEVIPKKNIKIIKMEDRPTAEAISYQLTALCGHIGHILNTESYVYFDCTPEEEIEEDSESPESPIME